jgi:hypothetical protein
MVTMWQEDPTEEAADGVEEAASALRTALESNGEVRTLLIRLKLKELVSQGWMIPSLESASNRTIGEIGQAILRGLAKDFASYGIREQFRVSSSKYELSEFRAPRMERKISQSWVDLGILKDNYSGLRAVIEIKTAHKSKSLRYGNTANQIEALSIIRKRGEADTAWLAVVGLHAGLHLQSSIFSLCLVKEVGLIYIYIDG